MKKIIKYFVFCLISIYGLYFVSACCTYCYQIWDRTAWAHQKYTIDSLTLASFKSKYMNYCQSKEVTKSFCSPYHNNVERVKFISQEKVGIIHCCFYSDGLNVLMKFYVEKKTSLKIYFWGIEYSCDNDLTPEDYTWNINDGSKTWSENNKYLNEFENEVLNNIGNYRRDYLQGFLCWYPFFFVNHLLYICMLGVFLILLVVLLLR